MMQAAGTDRDRAGTLVGYARANPSYVSPAS